MNTTFIKPDQLRTRLKNSQDKPFILLFTTFDSMSGEKPEDIRSLSAPVFIPNSVLFDFKNIICDQKSTLSNMMPNLEELEVHLAKLGLSANSEIIIYDDFGNFCASRVWFMLKSVGFNDVKVLSGGLPAWLDLNHETSGFLGTSVSCAPEKLKKSEQFRFVDADYVNSKKENQNVLILDARSPDRFKGKAKEKSLGVRSGHIPNSQNLYYRQLQNREGMLDNDDLQQLFNSFMEYDEWIFSCGSGVTACVLAQCFFEVKPNAKLCVYDGSWSEWGANAQYEIRTNS